MKILFQSVLIIISAFSAFLLSSCSAFENCICTTEFRTETVVVIGKQNKPVDSLNVEIKDGNGKPFNVQQDYFPEPGRYVVMDDSFTSEFFTVPKIIFFKAWNESASVEAEYGIITDDCKCHIYKTSGPDTLIININ